MTNNRKTRKLKLKVSSLEKSLVKHKTKIKRLRRENRELHLSGRN